MTDLGLRLPLRITIKGESVQIVDAAGVMAGHFYFSKVSEHGHAVGRVQRKQAIELARIAARAFTEALSASGG